MNKALFTTLFCTLTTLVGCSNTNNTTSNQDNSTSNSYMNSSGLCNADLAQGMLGKAPRPDVLAQAKQLSGATQIRTLLPGQVMTMEYNPQRLNILVGASDTITRINCG